MLHLRFLALQRLFQLRDTALEAVRACRIGRELALHLRVRVRVRVRLRVRLRVRVRVRVRPRQRLALHLWVAGLDELAQPLLLGPLAAQPPREWRGSAKHENTSHADRNRTDPYNVHRGPFVFTAN